MIRELDYKVPGGKLIRIRADLRNDRIEKVVITGDFFLHPEDGIYALEEALTGSELNRVKLQAIVERALAGCETVGISPDDITNALMMLIRYHKASL